MKTTELLKSKLEITGEIKDDFQKILSPEALQFIEELESIFGERRKELLTNRIKKQYYY